MDLKGGTITYANYLSHLMSAFKRDCENYLEEFEKYHSFSYTTFVGLWRKFNFSYVFAGHNYAIILHDFCENMYFTIKKYLVFQESIYMKVGAFYLLYGLYYKQPLKCWVKIRLTLTDFKILLEVMEKMRSESQFDVLYCYAKMKADNAFLYVCLPQLLGPEERFLKFNQQFVDDTFKFKDQESSVEKLKEIMSGNVFQEFVKTNTEYEGLFKKFAEKNNSMTVFESKIVDDFNKIYEKTYCKDSKEVNEEGSSKMGVVEKAVKNKNATYRGARKVITAVDESFSNINISEVGESSRVTRSKRKRK